MPSIINATTTNGVAISPDNSGSLQLATNNGTTAVTIDTSQNVGIGVTPSQRLHVASPSSTYIQVQNTGNSVNAYYGVDTAGGWMGTSTNHYAAFYTNNTERMRIDSSGRVTMPAQPSFYAYLTASQTTSSIIQNVQFNATRWDTGGNYNTSTYRYTAPVAGKYLFASTIASGGGGAAQQYFGVQFWVNGSQIVQGGWSRQENTGYTVDSKTAILNLNAGDYVMVYVEAQNAFTLNFSSAGSFVCGYLLG